MMSLVVRKETARQTPTLYLVYGYREIDEPNRWYVGSCRYIREMARDNQHRNKFGAGKKFRRELRKVASGRYFDELVDKVVLEIVWGTFQDCIDRENIHMRRLDSIKNGFNSGLAGWTNAIEFNKGRKRPAEVGAKISKSQKGKKLPEEQKRKLSQSAMGRTSPRKGVNLSKLTREKLSQSAKGRKHTEETKQKISNSLIGNQNQRKNKQNTLWLKL